MNLLAVDTLVPAKLPKRSYKVAFIGLFCLKTHLTFAKLAQDAK